MSSQPTLHTERLVLRPPAMSDAAEIRRLAGRREIAENTFLPHPYEEGMAEAFIQSSRSQWEEGEAAVFAIVLQNGDRQIGNIGLKEINMEHLRAEMGFWIGIDHWGNGYATEAGRAVVDFAFESLELNKVYANHFSTNPASGRVLQKIGMRKEGVRRQHIVRFGETRDLVLYGIVREEWEAMRRER